MYSNTMRTKNEGGIGLVYAGLLRSALSQQEDVVKSWSNSPAYGAAATEKVN